MKLEEIITYGSKLQDALDFDGWTFEYRLLSENEFYALNPREKVYASTALDGALKRGVVYMNADAVYKEGEDWQLTMRHEHEHAMLNDLDEYITSRYKKIGRDNFYKMLIERLVEQIARSTDFI